MRAATEWMRPPDPPTTTLSPIEAADAWPSGSAGRLGLPALPLGHASAASIGDKVVVGGSGGRIHSVAARIAAKQQFAGYWEYLLDEALFTAPADPCLLYT